MAAAHPQNAAREDLDEIATAYVRCSATAGQSRRAVLRNEVITGLLPFADRLARRYRLRGEPLDDLEQVARMGLVKAIDRYDPERGSFTAFAVITINGEIKRHFRDRTWSLHVTRRLQDQSLEVKSATELLSQRMSREPTTAELAGHLNMSEEDVRRARQGAADHTALSLAMPVGDDDEQELGDLVGMRDASIESLADRMTVTRLVRRLPARVQRIIGLRFYGNLTQAEIAEQLGISQMHVSRLLGQALSWLRAAMLSDVPPPWTGMVPDDDYTKLWIRLRHTAAGATVLVSGEIDRDNAAQARLRLREAIAQAPGYGLVVDLTRLPLVDAAGAAVLRDMAMAARLASVPLAITGLQPQVRRVLSVLGVDLDSVARRP
ncbi:SigB/SigF/SigG family RNA polymerase sigma factor [Actinoplanes sp. N902-109]|uniref:SigB/SigF/SigG family RNA polymerase sigma factor n=1 Tax=Actinoplanes sp. (strain N902-109) TaxID=649831 RepID=UPI0003294FFD|nr:SigB/SigF/SigG family RNA polymerase sigma factor [Actinoplanes sp. N902-109]AGL17995.1 RNA polymerase sigma-70 factor [Actinoplanes sp. N902-109]